MRCVLPPATAAAAVPRLLLIACTAATLLAPCTTGLCNVDDDAALAKVAAATSVGLATENLSFIKSCIGAPVSLCGTTPCTALHCTAEAEAN